MEVGYGEESEPPPHAATPSCVVAPRAVPPPSPFWPNPPPGMEEVRGNEDAEELASLSSPSCVTVGLPRCPPATPLPGVNLPPSPAVPCSGS